MTNKLSLKYLRGKSLTGLTARLKGGLKID